MFDIGFWELTVVAIVALIVIGPDKLPGLARTAGLWIGKARHFLANVKEDIDRELKADELRRALDNKADIDELKEILSTTRETVEREANPDYLVKAAMSDERPEASDEEAESAATEKPAPVKTEAQQRAEAEARSHRENEEEAKRAAREELKALRRGRARSAPKTDSREPGASSSDIEDSTVPASGGSAGSDKKNQ